MRSIIGNAIGRLLIRCPDLYAGTLLSICVRCFERKLWNYIASDIITNFAWGGGAIDWTLQDEGFVLMHLHTQGSISPKVPKQFVIVCELIHNCPHENFKNDTNVLIIHMREVGVGHTQQYTHRLGVSHDGMCLAYPRRYCDHCDCGESQRALDETTNELLWAHNLVNEYQNTTVFDTTWFMQHAT